MKKVLNLLLAIAGIAILLAGILIFTSEETKLYSGLCVGLGASFTVLGIGSFIQALVIPALESEKIRKQKEIEIKDERNTAIRDKTGHMVARCMNYAITAFILILAFMKADKAIIIMAASLIVIEFILTIIFSNYYAKKL